MEHLTSHDRGLDGTFALLREGYRFGARRFERLGADLFVARMMGEEAIWLRGPEATRLFYDGEWFQRAGAIPRRIRRTVTGEGGVQSLDGAAHQRRRALLMSLLTPIRAAELAELTEHAWLAALARWTRADSIDLSEESQSVLCRAACEWAGVPLAESDVVRRGGQLAALVDALGGVGPRHWRGRIARRSLEGWLGALVEEVRGGALQPAEGRALAAIAGHRDEDGAPLDARVAAVELIGLLRSIVSVARYATFAAHALHVHPRCALRLRDGDGGYARQFVQELRRFYPLAPFVAARVRTDFVWGGHRFREGTLVFLDIHATHRDPRCWPCADEFLPERFDPSGAAPFGLIPQGGGDPVTGHRCAGEAATIEILVVLARLLAGAMAYEVPAQDLDLDLDRIPTRWRGGFVIRGVGSTVNVYTAVTTSVASAMQEMQETTGVLP